ncbi:MAG: hypothetical protein JWM65_2967, partial [Sphingomonas bacterium]|nr:hypothetical protein [Sphingomonas bacterium]
TGEGVDRDHRPPKRLLPERLNHAVLAGLSLRLRAEIWSVFAPSRLRVSKFDSREGAKGLPILETGARFCYGTRITAFFEVLYA